MKKQTMIMINKKKTGTVITLLLCLIMTVGIYGTVPASYQEAEPVDGGTANRTDYSAPKEIISDTITGFDASFSLFTRWKSDEYDNFFRFRIKKDEQGVLTASEDILGISYPADEELLTALQEVITKNDLAALNGIYDVTAGLPPEYSEGGLTVDYDSGEVLSFTTDNNPYALWAEEVYDVFAEWFAANGNDSLYPPKEDSLVNYIRIYFIDKGLYIDCSETTVDESRAIDGETHLLCISVYDAGISDNIIEEYILFPEDYYETVTEIIDWHDIVRNYDFSIYDHDSGLFDMHDQGYYGMGSGKPADQETDSEDMSLDIFIEYESGRTLDIETAKESEIEALKPVLTELLVYYDNILWESSEKTMLDLLPPEFWETEPAGEQFSLIIIEPDDPEYSYIRCDYYLGDTQFGYFLGCPDEGDDFTHFDLTPDMFEGIETGYDLSDFHAELYLGYNENSGVDALMQAMMGNTGRAEFLASLQFAPEYGERYEYRIIPADDGYMLEENGTE